MYRMLFINRWIALAFVFLTVFSTIAIVGTEEKDGAIDRATKDLNEQRETFAKKAASFSQSEASDTDPGPTAFASDEDLIDDATGYDPTPDDGSGRGAADSGGPPDDVQLVDPGTSETETQLN